MEIILGNLNILLKWKYGDGCSMLKDYNYFLNGFLSDSDVLRNISLVFVVLNNSENLMRLEFVLDKKLGFFVLVGFGDEVLLV